MNHIMTETTTPLTNLPAEIENTTKMSPALAVFLNDSLFERCKQVATYLAGAKGFAPPHLIGCREACFAVVTRAIVWKLDPYALAGATYQTPGGKVGYEGKLIQAVLENSGKLEGGVKFEHYGPWEKVQGKFAKRTSDRGKEFFVPAWKPEDEAGVGVEVTAHLKGEAEPRRMKFDLIEFQPRNSTLWALSPRRQICYTAVRAFANLVVPHLVMGVAFDVDEIEAMHIGPDNAKDITPERPTRESVATAVAAERAATMTEIDPDEAESQEREMDRQAAAATTGRMPDTAEETGDEPEGDTQSNDDGRPTGEPVGTAATGGNDDGGPDLPADLDQRDRAKTLPATPATEQATDWKAVANGFLQAMVKAGNDFKLWKQFMESSRAQRDQMKIEAPTVWRRVQDLIEKKEASLRK